MPYQSAYSGAVSVPARVAYMGTRLGVRSHLSLVRSGRTRVGGYPRRLGQSSSDIGNLLGAGAGAGANAILPGSGSVVQPLVDSIAQVFGPNPVTGPDAERRSKMYTYYAGAMTSPGSAQSVCDAATLQAIATAGMTPSCNTASSGYENNPQSTRTFAQEALQALSSQGWIGTNTPSPYYTGIPQSGAIFAPGAQGQQQVVAQGAPLSGGGPLSFLTDNPLLLAGGGVLLAFLLLGRSSSAKAA